MWTIIVLIALVTIAAVVAVFVTGSGDAQRGRIRMIRRVRTVRRRTLAPLLRRLDRAAGYAWTRPTRVDLARQVRRIADRVERASAEADRFTTAEHELSKGLEKLQELAPLESYRTEHGRPRQTADTRRLGWIPAMTPLVFAAILTAGNGYVLYRYVLPVTPAGVIIPPEVDAFTIAIALSVLPFLFAIAYFAVSSAGRGLGLRTLGLGVVLLVLGLAAAEGGLVVLALEASGMADFSWWGGVAVSTLIAGSAALIPAMVSVLAHAGMERMSRWTADRARRLTDRARARQDQLAGHLRDTMEQMTSSMGSLRAEILALGQDPAGRLLLYPEGGPSVERASAVLHRLARSVDRGGDLVPVDDASPAHILSRLLVDLAALLVWLLAAAGVLTVAAVALRNGAVLGVTGLMTAATFAALTGLLLGGLVLRTVFASPGLRLGPAARTAGVFLFGLAVVSCAILLGPLAARDGGFFAGRTAAAAAWLNLMVLVAAIASVRVREGIAALAGAVTWVLVFSARLVVSLVDVVMAVFDRLLAGLAGSASPRRRTDRQARTAAEPALDQLARR